jgi:tetratricopeptide (TPR) repeat protein
MARKKNIPVKKEPRPQKKKQVKGESSLRVKGGVENSTVIVGNKNTIKNSTTFKSETKHFNTTIKAAKPREFAAYTLLVVLLVCLLGLGLNYFFFRYDRVIASGKLNVLVLPFLEEKPWGYVNSDLGWSIAQVFADGVKGSFEDENGDSDVKILGPSDRVPRIFAFNENQLSRSAETISEEVNGQIVIYGVISEDEYGDSIVSVKFYISPTNFGEAQELISDSIMGELSLGAFRLSGETVGGADLLAQNKELRERLGIFSALINFLGAYIGEDFVRAEEYIAQAGDLNLWSNTNGLEVIYLLNGNMEIRHARVLMVNKDLEGTQDSIDLARKYFKDALDVSKANGQGEYTRAYLGLAGIESLAAIVEANIVGDASLIDVSALENVLNYLDQAEKADYSPETADVSVKVNYSKAQVYLAYFAKTGDETYLPDAQKYYQLVVDEFERTGNKRIAEYAALSYSGLGHIALRNNQGEMAVADFLTAQDITNNPSLKVQCLVNIGDVYFSVEDYDNALKYYQDALKRRPDLEKAVSKERILQIEKRIDDIKNGGMP